ncbi:MAG: hypothetical protein LBV67_04445 [Streptococcaceae bacterium]|jgi:hypothetical protein|nr:hypothetical protein [Streptococcaceae bacterium]
MKKNATVENLCKVAWQTGRDKKGMYEVVREDDLMTLTIRNTTLAQFRVTGFEQGIVEFSEGKTDAQNAAIETFVGYFQGV